MKRVKDLFEQLISDENLSLAIANIKSGHHNNEQAKRIGSHEDKYIPKLREIIISGFIPHPPATETIWDKNAKKYRTISKPRLYPDQYIHHALIQVLQPVMMRGMDYYSCGSIRGRGIKHGKTAIENWMRNDFEGTSYCFEGDVYHFYDSIKPEFIINRFKQLIKDYRVLDLIERILSQGVLKGVYCSQWFANTLLQPIDVYIHKHSGCHHYIRYIDNFTVFGASKKKMRKLVEGLKTKLAKIGLTLKGNYQIYSIKDRLPNALGFRYGKSYTLLRKQRLLELKRTISKSYQHYLNCGSLSPKVAMGLMCKLGAIEKVSNVNIRQKYIPKHFKRVLRETISNDQKIKNRIALNDFLTQEGVFQNECPI